MPETPSDDSMATEPFDARLSEEARRAVYDVIALRRDVRHFRPGAPVDDETLRRVLGAAHLAPSVGFSQPWGFVIVRDEPTRTRIRESFIRCRETEAARFPPGRREKYLAYRLEGILEAPLNVCVTVDLRSRGEAILGTTVQPEAVRASVCCAVQNLWLAARAEGVGVGWVSIVEPAVLRSELGLPPGVEPMAYLCVGRPVEFRTRPMLEESGWLERRGLDSVLHRDRWREPDAAAPSAHADAGPPAGGGEGSDPAARARATGAARQPSATPAGGGEGFDPAARARAEAHQRDLTKPPGSLGRLEELATWYAGVIGRFPCEPPDRARVAVFAADHGVVVEAVSAYSSQMTAATVCNIMAGGAAINILAARYGVAIDLVDVGVAGDLSAAPVHPVVALRRARVRAGTRNLRCEPAMTRAEADGAMDAGRRVADDAADDGATLVATGEVGIGNTTAAAALVCAFTGADPEQVVGPGTGIDEAARARKVDVVRDALGRRSPLGRDPIDILASLGGLELAATAGFILRAADRRLAVVLDGFLACASALVAAAIDPGVLRVCLASHASAEPGSAIALRHLGLAPLLSLGLRLGEGTGAVLAIDLVRSAVALQSRMATFATAGIVGRGAGR
ncbi:MAG: nicotinate-nucleotide--dimethylbenzimidazole phosphoribosyltransferase [Polyangiaceae bacterium]